MQLADLTSCFGGAIPAVIVASLCAAVLLLGRFFWTARGLHHG